MRYVIVGLVIDEQGRVLGNARSKHSAGLKAIEALFELQLTMPAKKSDFRDPPQPRPGLSAIAEDPQPYARDPRSHLAAGKHLAPADDPRTPTDAHFAWNASPPGAFRSRTSPRREGEGSWRRLASALDKNDPDDVQVSDCLSSLGIKNPRLLIDRYGTHRCLRVLRSCACKRNVRTPRAWVLCALSAKWDVDEQTSPTECRRGDSNSHPVEPGLGPEPSYTPSPNPR